MVDQSIPTVKNSNSLCRGLQGMDPVSNQDAPILKDSSEEKLVIKCMGSLAGIICNVSGIVSLPIAIFDQLVGTLSEMQNSRKILKNEEIDVVNTANTTPVPTRQWADGFVTPPTVKKWSGENKTMLFESEQGHDGQQDIKTQDKCLGVEQLPTKGNDNKFVMVKRGYCKGNQQKLNSQAINPVERIHNGDLTDL